MRKISFLLLALISLAVFSTPVYARITPEDIINEQKAVYNSRVKNYSPANKQKLETMNKKIHELNRKICGDLEDLMLRQGIILDEYQRRNGGVETEAMKESRYWITYAHEAVAYQAAKVYVYDLSGEANVDRDINITINQLLGEITTLKSKVVKSQNILKSVVAGSGNKTPAKQTQGGEG